MFSTPNRNPSNRSDESSEDEESVTNFNSENLFSDNDNAETYYYNEKNIQKLIIEKTKDSSDSDSFKLKLLKRNALNSTPSTVAESPGTDDSPNDNQISPISHGSRTSSTSSPMSSSKRNLFSSIMPSNSIGSLWTVEMTSLKQSGSHFEAVECLRRIRVLLSEIDKSDRLKFCKADYENSTKSLRKRRQLWSDDLFREVVTISTDFFSESHFHKLPTDVIIEIFLWLPIDKFSPVTSVCWEWCEIGCCDQLWGCFYRQKFLLNNPGAMPTLEKFDFMSSFRQRLSDPQIGDKVEVAWRGKFRLETQDVYQGLAWWVAEVVDKHNSQGRYKIRYPGWESRWDEWVPRVRLRWTVSRNTLVSINVNDIVELWCCGANVPGAWLESKVKKIRNGRYCIGRVLSSGYLWVERDRLRLVRRANEVNTSSRETDENAGSARRSLFGSSISSLSERFSLASMPREEDGNRRTSSCSIM